MFCIGFMLNWNWCFFSTCNGHWVKSSRSFYLPLTHFVYKFINQRAHMAVLGKHLVIFVSASQWRTRPRSLSVYSIFSNYIVAGCFPEVTWTTIWNCGRSFHKIGVVQKFLAVMEINPQKESNTEPVRNTANLRACLGFNQGIFSPSVIHFNLQNL